MVRGIAQTAWRSLSARADTNRTEAEDEFRQALAISREQDAKLLELRALSSLVRLRGRSGMRDSHYDALRALVSEFPEPHETPDLEDARAQLSLPERKPARVAPTVT